MKFLNKFWGMLRARGQRGVGLVVLSQSGATCLGAWWLKAILILLGLSMASDSKAQCFEEISWLTQLDGPGADVISCFASPKS